MATVIVTNRKEANTVKFGDQVVFNLRGSEKIIEDTTMEVVDEICKKECDYMDLINANIAKQFAKDQKALHNKK